MALKQEIVKENGAKVLYHRISKLEFDCDAKQLKISIRSYVAQSLRDAEKAETAIRIETDNLMHELDEIVAAPTPENEQRRIELSKQINNAVNKSQLEVERHLIEAVYDTDYSDDKNLSLASAYAWLKANIYQDAEDC